VLSRDRDNSAQYERCRELDIQDHGSGDSGVVTTGIGKPLAIQGWRALTYKFGAVLFAIEGDDV
jgi:hypothetical protein